MIEVVTHCIFCNNALSERVVPSYKWLGCATCEKTDYSSGYTDMWYWFNKDNEIISFNVIFDDYHLCLAKNSPNGITLLYHKGLLIKTFHRLIKFEPNIKSIEEKVKFLMLFD